MVATLGLFGWDHVAILATDTPYAKDLATTFSSVWKGEVAYYATIALEDGEIDRASAIKVLEDAPTDPRENSRVVLLLAHHQHAYPFLKLAVEQNFQPDTIFIAPDGWADNHPPDESWLPEFPGYIGITPLRNRDAANKDFLQRFQSSVLELHGPEAFEPFREGLPTSAAENTVDSIVAMAMALSATPPRQRNNGTAVTAKLRELDFAGVSGRFQTTPEGDRLNPQFTIFNLQKANNGYKWVDVATTGNQRGSARFGLQGIGGLCFAQVGCGLDAAPEATYPVPRNVWILILGPSLCLGALGFLFYRRRKILKARHHKATIAEQEKEALRQKAIIREKERESMGQQAIIRAKEAELENFRNSVVSMCTAKKQYVPVSSTVSSLPDTVEVPSETGTPSQWYWKETEGYMHLHDDNVIRNLCWVKYDDASNEFLEASYQEQGGQGTCKPSFNYTVDFGTMTQTKNQTGFQRQVMRVSLVDNKQKQKRSIDLSGAHVGEGRPAELADEPQMVLVVGDIVQVSKQRDDGWAYGTKLHFSDEPLVRRLVQVAVSGDNESEDDSKVQADTGWFPLDATRVPNTDDLATLRNSVGDTSDLEAPSCWNAVVDPSVVQNHVLPDNSQERQQVVGAFLSSIRGSCTILRVERIQNLAMWQSYVVKRKTVMDRDRSGRGDQQALARFERRWLWHGTSHDVLHKITQQGFNRSFCGKNATVYGKGVYFARDSSYSSSETYATPDDYGNQFMFACRVVVGEYCKGHHDARTPALRDAVKNMLYDSTVDTTTNPNIYVTYHDAQAYPEYLVVFNKN